VQPLGRTTEAAEIGSRAEGQQPIELRIAQGTGIGCDAWFILLIHVHLLSPACAERMTFTSVEVTSRRRDATVSAVGTRHRQSTLYAPRSTFIRALYGTGARKNPGPT
jgi:hypothetical protein